MAIDLLCISQPLLSVQTRYSSPQRSRFRKSDTDQQKLRTGNYIPGVSAPRYGSSREVASVLEVLPTSHCSSFGISKPTLLQLADRNRSLTGVQWFTLVVYGSKATELPETWERVVRIIRRAVPFPSTIAVHSIHSSNMVRLVPSEWMNVSVAVRACVCGSVRPQEL